MVEIDGGQNFVSTGFAAEVMHGELSGTLSGTKLFSTGSVWNPEIVYIDLNDFRALRFF
ncbi:MAG: hypothetical protein IPL58_09465 [Betaproteobacteria bacterium]|uniref:Uncharacterized protein n=1 Tax=Candidatus Proximibacter danicus TaxID=2954365 RepID=A0A9D7PQD3_9PROT|nr:hypothetical protein [Candidatus Proximibacter danicus]